MREKMREILNQNFIIHIFVNVLTVIDDRGIVVFSDEMP